MANIFSSAPFLFLVFSQIRQPDIHHTDKNNRYYACIKNDFAIIGYQRSKVIFNAALKQLHRQTFGIRCECQGSSDMTIINGNPMSQ